MAKATVSCIVPAYNEDRSIAKVLKVVCGHPLVREVIVVDDGSKDNTAAVVKQFPSAKLIRQVPNKGKSHAVFLGIRAAKSKHVMLLDADLIGLTAKNITDLIVPVTTGKVGITMSMRKYVPYKYLGGVDPVTGDRVFSRSLLGSELKRIAGFELEVHINKLIIKQQIPLRVVRWSNVRSLLKVEKNQTIWSSLKAEYAMYQQVFRTTSFSGLIKQVRELRALRR